MTNKVWLLRYAFAVTFAKLVLGAPNGNAKHQLGSYIGGSVPKLEASHDIGEGIVCVKKYNI